VKAFDDLIQETLDVLRPFSPRAFPYDPEKSAPLGESNELILQKEQAFELGAGGFDSLSFLSVSQNASLIEKDETILVGPDLDAISSDCSYARIVFIEVDDVEKNGPDAFYAILKNIEISKYSLAIKGFMIRASALTMREQVRVSRKAIKDKLTFEKIGNQFIKVFHKDPHVLKVKVIFVTSKEGPYSALENIASKSNERSEAYNHMLKDSVMNCKRCEWKPVCAEIDEMKEFHKKMMSKKK